MAALAAWGWLLTGTGQAEVLISVDKVTQRMVVAVNGELRHSWPVSTGMPGYATPAGSFAASRLVRDHRSREWDDAPMPHSIFFTDAGHAIHGSAATGRLGTRASHGCVRLSPANAAALFELVKAEGIEAARIEIRGSDPVWTAGGAGRSGDYSRLTNFDPLTAMGIMTGGEGARR
jgi:hypothetical protein